jgi:putative transposase
MAKGFLCLVAIIDWTSRAVLAWRLSNTMGTAFCLEALPHFGKPEIFLQYPSLSSGARL